MPGNVRQSPSEPGDALMDDHGGYADELRRKRRYTTTVDAQIYNSRRRRRYTTTATAQMYNYGGGADARSRRRRRRTTVTRAQMNLHNYYGCADARPRPTRKCTTMAAQKYDHGEGANENADTRSQRTCGCTITTKAQMHNHGERADVQSRRQRRSATMAARRYDGAETRL